MDKEGGGGTKERERGGGGRIGFTGGNRDGGDGFQVGLVIEITGGARTACSGRLFHTRMDLLTSRLCFPENASRVGAADRRD